MRREALNDFYSVSHFYMELKKNETDINLGHVNPIDAVEINKYLETCGKNPYGKPLYRLVWSDDMLELRGNSWQQKYNYIKERWLLEKWWPPDMYENKELPLSKFGYYEVFYVFENNYKPLPLNKRVVEIIMYQLLNRSPKDIAQRILEAENEMREREEKLDKYWDDFICDDSPLINQLHVGDAIVVPEGYKDKE